MREPDAAFADPCQAVLYGVFDVGCGTGALAVRLAAAGLEVVGVDPADASLDVARAKAGADLVSWIHGDATDLIDLGPSIDLAVMTGNVAQVFVSDEDWSTTPGRGAARACGRAAGSSS